MSSSLHPEPKTLVSDISDENIEKIAPIESLPVELSLILLKSIPDRTTLRALNHASPACRRIFQCEHHNILKSVIENDLGPALAIEAKAVTKIRALCTVRKQGPKVSWETWCVGVQRLLEEWRAERNSFEAFAVGGMHGSFGVLDKSYAVDMAHMHDHVETLTKECYGRLPLPGTEIFPMEYVRDPEGITKMEKHRIQRALYRIEGFTHLFRRVLCGSVFEEAPPTLHRWQQMSMLYFQSAGIDEWEVEEFNCVLDWMYYAHWDILTNVKSSIVELDIECETEYRSTPMTNAPWERVHRQRDDDWKHRQCEVGLMFGIPFLGNLLRAKSPKEKVVMMKIQLSPRPLSQISHFSIRSLHRLHQRGQHHSFVRPKLLKFDGDIVTGPNLAWSAAQHCATENCWKILQNQWGSDSGRERLCRWGYCLWDEDKFIGQNSGDWKRYWDFEWSGRELGEQES